MLEWNNGSKIRIYRSTTLPFSPPHLSPLTNKMQMESNIMTNTSVSVTVYLSFSICLSPAVPLCAYICLSLSLSVCLYPSHCVCHIVFISLGVSLSVRFSMCVFLYLRLFLPRVCVCVSLTFSLSPCVGLSLYVHLCVSFATRLYLSPCLYASVCLSFCLFWSLYISLRLAPSRSISLSGSVIANIRCRP